MISTRNISNSEENNTTGFIKPLIEPGNFKLKINKVFLRPEAKVEFGVKLILALETEPITGNFKGFKVDAPAVGTFKGQIGNVGYSKWGFRDFVTNSDVQIFKEEEILKAIKTICDTLGIQKWFEDADGRFDSIEKFVEGFSLEAPFAGIYAYYCIAGREFASKDGKHINHELFLPPSDRNLGKAFSLNPDKVQKFFKSTHVEPLKPKADQATQKAEPAEIKKAELPSQDLVNKAVESTKEQRNLDFLNSINEPVKEEPVRPKVTSAAEASFMNEGKQKIETPFTDEINKESEQSSDIITSSSENPYMPWDVEFAEWEKNNKK